MVLDAPPVAYWNSHPYALAFSPDGQTLAVGSGGWYGCGGVSWIHLASRATLSEWRFVPDSVKWIEGASWIRGTPAKPTAQARVPESLTVPGVVFDRSGERLLLSTWSSRQHDGPTYLLALDAAGFALDAAFAAPAPTRYGRCPTGALLDGTRVVVRCNAHRLDDVFRRHRLPGPPRQTHAPHRSHVRVVRQGERFYTGGGGSLRLGGWRAGEGEFESHRAAAGLVVGDPDRAHSIRTRSARITSVLAHPDGRLITGGLDGELDAWRTDEAVPLRDAVERQGRGGGPWATYKPASVVALCALYDGRFFSVDAGGEVLEWEGTRITRRWSMPRPGTPRCAAVHPDVQGQPHIAVGVKESQARRGYIALWPL